MAMTYLHQHGILSGSQRLCARGTGSVEFVSAAMVEPVTLLSPRSLRPTEPTDPYASSWFAMPNQKPLRAGRSDA